MAIVGAKEAAKLEIDLANMWIQQANKEVVIQIILIFIEVHMEERGSETSEHPEVTV